ncbi:MAG TPA: DUF2142 domain-containing protein [Candidatus Saccharimonadales bacterium]|nr:DUF2142 domain-containing protein [Candidatus Saccharimonadales bacterium]
MQRFRMVFKKACRRATVLVASNAFFYLIIAAAVLQACWYIFTIGPGINDEGRHLANIAIYSHHISPFLGKQNSSWDKLGEVVRDGSFMFYYLMGWLLRLIRLFTSDQTAQIIALRLICTAFFASGIVLYRKVFLALRLPKSVTHGLLLFFITIPTVAILPATVNYDNLAFLLCAVLLLLAIRAIQQKAISFPILAGIVITGLFMSVVKWSSVGLFLPIILFVAYDLWRKFGFKSAASHIYTAAQKTRRLPLVLLLVGLVIGCLLFIERPVANTLRYGKPEPSCQAVIGVKRCQVFPDYNSYHWLLVNKPASFRPYDPVQYVFVLWEKRMVVTADNVLERGSASELPVMLVLYSTLGVANVVLILLYARDIFKNNRAHQLLGFTALFYTALLLFTEYQSYVTYGQLTAVRARYLIPVLPILMYFATLSAIRLFGKRKQLLVPIAVVLLLASTQGGGIITYLLTTPQNLYWDKPGVKTVNTDLQKFLDPLVKS